MDELKQLSETLKNSVELMNLTAEKARKIAEEDLEKDLQDFILEVAEKVKRAAEFRKYSTRIEIPLKFRDGENRYKIERHFLDRKFILPPLGNLLEINWSSIK